MRVTGPGRIAYATIRNVIVPFVAYRPAIETAVSHRSSTITTSQEMRSSLKTFSIIGALALIGLPTQDVRAQTPTARIVPHTGTTGMSQCCSWDLASCRAATRLVRPPWTSHRPWRACSECRYRPQWMDDCSPPSLTTDRRRDLSVAAPSTASTRRARATEGAAASATATSSAITTSTTG